MTVETRPAIRLRGVSKGFRRARSKPFLAKELVRAILQRPADTEFHWALRDVSLTVDRGEAIGVIGTNGSGKSTLLALVAGTSYATQGDVEVDGRVGPLLELGAGFHPDLTGRENVILNGSLLGMTRDELRDRVDAIIEFSGLGDAIDAQIGQYSTGMTARLGFAVIAHADPDLLLVDEALSVGDAEFQRKCEVTVAKLRARGVTMMVVSHDLQMIAKLCSRVLWLHEGSVRQIGPAQSTLDEYWAFAQRSESDS